MITYVYSNKNPKYFFSNLQKHFLVLSVKFSNLSNITQNTQLILFEPCLDIETDRSILRDIKKQNNNIPIVIISDKISMAYLLLTIREKSLDFIHMPQDHDRLLGLIQTTTTETHSDSKAPQNLKNNVAVIHKSTKTKQAETHIENNYQQKITVDDLSKICHMSQASFLRYFKREIGTSPTKYIIEFRINKSLERLKTSSLTIAEIAYAVGFDDTSYFIKTFKSIVGITPNEFKQQKLKEWKSIPG